MLTDLKLLDNAQYFDSQSIDGSEMLRHSLYSPGHIKPPCNIPDGGLPKLSITVYKQLLTIFEFILSTIQMNKPFRDHWALLFSPLMRLVN